MPKPLVIVLGTLLIAVAGCHSSGVAQRKGQRLEAYRSLDAGTRKLVDQGRIQKGMDTNSVFIAWGQPTDAFTIGLPGGGQRMIWNYEKKWAYEFKQRTPVGSYFTTPAASDEARKTTRWRIPITYVAKTVTFADGKVIEWKKFDPPAYSQPTDVPPVPGRRY